MDGSGGAGWRRLVAYDGSPSALGALLHAIRLHHPSHDHLGLIHVFEPGEHASLPLAEGGRLLSELGIDATPIGVADQNPARAICIAAERYGYDTIVIGRRNRREHGLSLLGSVANRVVAGAPGHVIVVA